MTALWRIFRMILREQPVAFWRGAALSVVVLVMGAALLGLSGWFITAAAAAGLAGMGAVFDVFRPSAMVRFLALGRAGARYGERVLTHDATLRALEVLRARLLGGLVAAPYGRMVRIRGAQALNRLTADIDALDGVSLRLGLPIVAGLITQILAFAMLWWLVGLPVALWVFAGFVVVAALVFWATARRTVGLSRRAEAAAQAFRSRLIDLIRARRDLVVTGQLHAQANSVMAADDRRQVLRREQDRIERRAGAALQALSGLVAGGALFLGISMVQAGQIAPPFAALGFFAALALAETIAPLRRAASDLGRMIEAARRVSRDIRPLPERDRPEQDINGDLVVDGATVLRPGSDAEVIKDLTVTVHAGETVALTGASGAGKSTLLLAVAGLHPMSGGRISVGGSDISNVGEQDLREAVTLLPQRSALMAGSVADALGLASPDAGEDAFDRVLDAVQLRDVVAAKGGLASVIGPRGEGLSGGEARRLTLARAILRQPKVLLLDEPTEGLDDATAAAVLDGIRQYLPHAAILIASHRSVETHFADRVVSVN